LKVKSAFSLFGVPLGGVGTINPVGGADEGKSISEVAIGSLTGTKFFDRGLGVHAERAAEASEIACEVFSCPIIVWHFNKNIKRKLRKLIYKMSHLYKFFWIHQAMLFLLEFVQQCPYYN
jgi:hypothetical protein